MSEVSGDVSLRGGRPLFRSYAGMTRIRFKGPAHRHLSTVRCSPRNRLENARACTQCQGRSPVKPTRRKIRNAEQIFVVQTCSDPATGAIAPLVIKPGKPTGFTLAHFGQRVAPQKLPGTF